jgi:hypothetical protein
MTSTANLHTYLFGAVVIVGLPAVMVFARLVAG